MILTQTVTISDFMLMLVGTGEEAYFMVGIYTPLNPYYRYFPTTYDYFFFNVVIEIKFFFIIIYNKRFLQIDHYEINSNDGLSVAASLV